MKCNFYKLTSVLATSIIFAGNAVAVTIEFPDFSDTSGLTLNGNTTTTTTSDGAVLRLTSATTYQVGSAFSSTTINATDFSSAFQFRITDKGGAVFDCNTVNGADGLVFVAQSVSSSIGGGGLGIGYAGINNSVGVEFDTWCNEDNNDPSSNHIGINLNGDVNHGIGSPNTVNVSPDFDDGNLWYAWVDYNGTTLEVRANQTGAYPATSLISQTLDIPSILGQNTAFIGFTSGTGAAFGNHDIISWQYEDTFNPPQPPNPTTTPEPSTILSLLSLGILGGISQFKSTKK